MRTVGSTNKESKKGLAVASPFFCGFAWRVWANRVSGDRKIPTGKRILCAWEDTAQRVIILNRVVVEFMVLARLSVKTQAERSRPHVGDGVFDRGDEMVSSRRRGAEPSKAVRTEESLVDRSKLPAFFSHAWFLVGSVESILLVTWPSFASRSTSGWRRFGRRRSRKFMRLG